MIRGVEGATLLGKKLAISTNSNGAVRSVTEKPFQHWLNFNVDGIKESKLILPKLQGDSFSAISITSINCAESLLATLFSVSSPLLSPTFIGLSYAIRSRPVVTALLTSPRAPVS